MQAKSNSDYLRMIWAIGFKKFIILKKNICNKTKKQNKIPLEDSGMLIPISDLTSPAVRDR